MWSIGCILAELITRRVLFSTGNKNNNSRYDQLPIIIKTLGTPDKIFLDKLTENLKNYVNSFEKFSAVPWKMLLSSQQFFEFKNNFNGKL